MSPERTELLEAAATLIAELRKITGPVNTVVNHLIGASDADKVSDADTMEAAKGVITRKLTIKNLADKAKPKIVLSAEDALAEADGQVKQKRKRGPVSPERKAQLVEALKKARAAKGKK